jgi:hypothetical protein
MKICFVSKGPTSAVYFPSYFPAQPPGTTLESLQTVSFNRCELGLSLQVVQNQYLSCFLCKWSSSSLNLVLGTLPPMESGQHPAHWQLCVGWEPWTLALRWRLAIRRLIGEHSQEELLQRREVAGLGRGRGGVSVVRW